jgi:hypothetical protein
MPGASRASSTLSGPMAKGTITPIMTKNSTSVSASPPMRRLSRRSRMISALKPFIGRLQ